MRIPATIFYSYAHADTPYRKTLEAHLSLLRQQKLIAGWHDRYINGGQEWSKEISEHLENAQIILLLISSAFLNSDYCYGVEMARALEKHQEGSACVIPIILRHVDWHEAPFSRLQALPTKGEPVVGGNWRSEDEAFADIAKNIRKIIENSFSQNGDDSQQEIHQVSSPSLPSSSLALPQTGTNITLSQKADAVEGQVLGGKANNVEGKSIHINQTVEDVKESGSVIGFIIE